MNKLKKIEIDWLDDADPEVATMNAITQVMGLASYGMGDIEADEEGRIARWFYSKYGGDK